MAAPSDQDPPGAFRWNPFVGVAIALVLLMLALPIGMVGWFLRGYQIEKTSKPPQKADDSPAEASESDDLLRQALELAATNWNPTTEIDFPEIQLIVPAGKEPEAIDLLQSWANQIETILLPLAEEPGEVSLEYLVRLQSNDFNKLEENVKNKYGIKCIINIRELIAQEGITIKITIKPE